MNNIVYKTYDKSIDLSHIAISTHAIFQYNTKCSPSLNLIDVIKIMKKKLKNVKQVELKNKNKYKHNSNYYIDEDKNIYVVANNKIVTTYPSQRIFHAKPVYANKKVGQGWK